LPRIVKYAHRFKHDYRRESSGQHGKTLDWIMMEVVDPLVTDALPPRRSFDHALTGDWHDHRGCHAKPDFVLIIASLTVERWSW